jgi:2'-5' RNA ligase
VSALRLFLALDLPEAHRAEIGRRAVRLEGSLPAARWVPPENLHLTLVFLGATEESAVPCLTEALAPAFAAAGGPLELRVSGAGTFPPARPARVAWVGIDGGDPLLDLQRRVAEAAAGCPVLEPERRPFHPHVTLARPRRPWNRRASEDLVRAFEGGVGGPFPVIEGVLYRSELSPRGARYTAVERFPL